MLARFQAGASEIRQVHQCSHGSGLCTHSFPHGEHLDTTEILRQASAYTPRPLVGPLHTLCGPHQSQNH